MKRNLGTGLSIFVLLLVFTNCFNSYDTLLKLQNKFSKQIKTPVDDSILADVCEGNSLTPSIENKCTELTFAPKEYKKTKSVIFTVRQDIANKFVCDNLKSVSEDLKEICKEVHSHFIKENKSHKVIDQVLQDVKIKNVLSINNRNFSNKIKVLVLKINKDLHPFLNYFLDKNVPQRKSFQYLRFFDLLVIQAGKSKFIYRTGNKNFHYSLSKKTKNRISHSLHSLKNLSKLKAKNSKNIKNPKTPSKTNMPMQTKSPYIIQEKKVKKTEPLHRVFKKTSIKESFEKFKTVFKNLQVCSSGSPLCKQIMGFYLVNCINIRNYFSYFHPILDMSLSKGHKGYVEILFEDYKLWFKPRSKVSLKLKFTYNTFIKPKIAIAQRAEKKLIVGLKQSHIINNKLEKLKKRLIALRSRGDHHHLTLPITDINKKALNYMHRLNDLFKKIKRIEHTSYEIEKAEFMRKQAKINQKNNPVKFIGKNNLAKRVSTPRQNIKRHLRNINRLIKTTYGNPTFIQMGSEKIVSTQDQQDQETSTTSTTEPQKDYDDLYYSNQDKDRESYLENSVNERAKGNNVNYSNNIYKNSNLNLYSTDENDSYTSDENFETLE